MVSYGRRESRVKKETGQDASVSEILAEYLMPPIESGSVDFPEFEPQLVYYRDKNLSLVDELLPCDQSVINVQRTLGPAVVEDRSRQDSNLAGMVARFWIRLCLIFNWHWTSNFWQSRRTPFPRFLLCQFDTDCQISLAIVHVRCPQPPAIHRASSDAIRQGRPASYAVELVPIPFFHSPSIDSLSLAQATAATNCHLPRCSITHRHPPRQPPWLPPL
ncbi:unnamed protein product, partial [Citrullus colocynthis]